MRTFGEASDEYLRVRRPELRAESVKAIRTHLVSVTRHVGTDVTLVPRPKRRRLGHLQHRCRHARRR